MKEIQKKICKLDHVLTGTITKRYSPCGKETCRCRIDERYWHGPYYLWTRKEGGKTVTRSLSQKQAAFVKRATLNMEKIKNYLEKWKSASVKILETMES